MNIWSYTIHKRTNIKVSVFGPWAIPEDWERRFDELSKNTIEYEIVISGPNEPEFSLPQNVTFIHVTPDPGQCRCSQIAANQCSGEVLIQIPDDCTFSPYALDSMYAAYVKENDYRTILLPHWGTPNFYLPEIPSLEATDGRQLQWGSCAGFSRHVFVELGGYDRRFNVGPYDADLQCRIFAIGGKHVWVDGAFVYEDFTLSSMDKRGWSGDIRVGETALLYDRWLINGDIHDKLMITPTTPFEPIGDSLYVPQPKPPVRPLRIEPPPMGMPPSIG